MKTTKSPRRVLVEAYLVAQGSLSCYSHRFSPRKFTQHQLFACLVLKDFYNLTYRGVVALLRDCVNLRDAIELTTVPHFTTLQKAADRLLLSRHFRALLETTVERAKELRILASRPRLTAIDTSGFESNHVSRYYAGRRKKGGKQGKECKVRYRRYPKLGMLCDCDSHLILAAKAGQGPTPDFAYFPAMLRDSSELAKPHTVIADAGFDSEANHELARNELGIQSLIAPFCGRPSSSEPKGRYRRAMKRHLKQSRYGQRWQSETVFSMIKRLSGEVVSARSYWRKCRLLLLKVLTHNLSLLAALIGFLLSRSDPFFDLTKSP